MDKGCLLLLVLQFNLNNLCCKIKNKKKKFFIKKMAKSWNIQDEQQQQQQGKSGLAHRAFVKAKNHKGKLYRMTCLAILVKNFL